MIQRITRAVQADATLYEEVEHSPQLTTEAYTIVGGIAAIAALFGLGNGITGALVAAIAVVVSYLLWTFATYFIGTTLFGGKATWQEMQRTIAYAIVPTAVGTGLSWIPVVGWIISLAASLWTIYLVFVAIRQGLDIDNQKAILTAVISGVAIFVVNNLLLAIF